MKSISPFAASNPMELSLSTLSIFLDLYLSYIPKQVKLKERIIAVRNRMNVINNDLNVLS